MPRSQHVLLVMRQVYPSLHQLIHPAGRLSFHQLILVYQFIFPSVSLSLYRLSVPRSVHSSMLLLFMFLIRIDVIVTLRYFHRRRLAHW